MRSLGRCVAVNRTNGGRCKASATHEVATRDGTAAVTVYLCNRHRHELGDRLSVTVRLEPQSPAVNVVNDPAGYRFEYWT